MDFLSNLNIDAILSDPLLVIGLSLLILGPLGFIFALFKLVRLSRKNKAEFVIPPNPEQFGGPTDEEKLTEEIDEEPAESSDKTVVLDSHASQNQPELPTPPSSPAPTPVSLQSNGTSEPAPVSRTITSSNSSETGQLRAQIDILVSHMKSLHNKISELEQQVELLEKHKSASLEPNKLKEAPMDPADFTQKLVKLAEHVIVLEKEMARLKADKKPTGAMSTGADLEAITDKTMVLESSAVQAGGIKSTKPPIMPL